MILLDCTIPNIGRVLLHDNYTLEEVLFVPGLDQSEIMLLESLLENKRAPWIAPHEALLAALASAYGIIPQVVFHADNSAPVIPELPHMT